MWPKTSASQPQELDNVRCPLGEDCELPYCIFSHPANESQRLGSRAVSKTLSADGEPANKRLKLDEDADQVAERSEHDISWLGPIELQAPTHATVSGDGCAEKRNRVAASKPESEPEPEPEPETETAHNGGAFGALPRTAARPVSPRPKKAGQVPAQKPEDKVELMPRKVQKEPATMARRLTMLKALLKEITKLNDQVKRAVKPELRALHLDATGLIKLVVEEEYLVAKENGLVYDNVMKQRIHAASKMTAGDYIRERKKAEAIKNGVKDAPRKPQRVETGMTMREEITMLSSVLATEADLVAHGVRVRPTTDSELAEARQLQRMIAAWEQCERCDTRFQVFQDRSEVDGSFTTGGKCRHHWGKRNYPKKKWGELSEVATYTCCNEPLGSFGCTLGDTHVYKVKDPKLMSLFLPFIETPENDAVEPGTAVCFDCEMAYTTQGLELLRLTLISWPNHRPLVDVLVRPQGWVLDFNTRFSGVTHEQFVNAKPYDAQIPKPVRKDLRIVESPRAARDLFLAHVSPNTPVLGHAIDNDLNVIRLVHPAIADTVMLYPSPSGLPYRHGLRNLAKWHLKVDIQQGGAAGHDSYEDAKTTGELIRVKLAEKWKSLRTAGWTMRDDKLFPPISAGPSPPSPPTAFPAPSMTPGVGAVEVHGEKRKHEEV